MKQKNLNQYFEKIEKRIEEKYVIYDEANGEKLFYTNEGNIFKLTKLPWANALVIEYAETLEEAKRNIFEDGDLYYLDEMNETEMFEAMVIEIN